MRPETLRRWGRCAPTACLDAAAGLDPWPRSRVASFLAGLRPLDVSPVAGRAWFPVLAGGTGDGIDGGLVPVAAGDAAGRALPTDGIRRAVAAALAIDAPLELGAITLRTPDAPDGLDPVGDSWQLAGAVAFVSALLGRPDAAPRVTSGRLDPEDPGWILPVEGAARKHAIARREAPGAQVRIVTARLALRDVLDEAFGPGWRAELITLGGRSAYALAHEAHDLLFAGSGRNDEALTLAEAAIAAGAEGGALGVARWVRGLMRVHRGETATALPDLQAAVALLEPDDDRFGGFDPELARTSLALAWLDLGRPGEAAELLAPTLDDLRSRRDARASRPWRDAVLRVAGTLHRARVGVGDADGALAALQVALEVGALPEERCRHLLDRAEVHRRCDRPDQARADLAAAAQHLADVRGDDRASTRRFLDLYRVRAGVGAATWPVEAPTWTRWPQPAEALEALLAGPPDDLDAWVDAHVRDDAPLVHRLVVLGALARATRRHGRAPEGTRRLVDGVLAEPVDAHVREALLRLRDGDPDPWTRRAMY